MILGVGTDLVEIRRMERACKKDYFVVRTFTDMESRQAKGSVSKLAGSFAVKEAVAKALGTGFRTFMPIDVEVLRDDVGKPYVKITTSGDTIIVSTQTTQARLSRETGEVRFTDANGRTVLREKTY